MLTRNRVGIAADSGVSFIVVSVTASNNILSHNSADGILVFGSGARLWATGNTATLNAVYGLNNLGGLFETAGNNAVRNNGVGDTFGAITSVGTK